MTVIMVVDVLMMMIRSTFEKRPSHKFCDTQILCQPGYDDIDDDY